MANSSNMGNPKFGELSNEVIVVNGWTHNTLINLIIYHDDRHAL